MSRALLAALLLLAGACADGRSYLLVTVKGLAQLPGYDHLHVTLLDGGQIAALDVAPDHPVVDPASFALAFDAHRRGNLEVVVEATTAGGLTLSSGEARATIAPSHVATVTVTLAGWRGDLAGASDLAAAADAGPD